VNHLWEILATVKSGAETYTIRARKGACVLVSDKLSAEDVKNFDPQARWDASKGIKGKTTVTNTLAPNMMDVTELIGAKS
jgi:hypothetical protein